MLRQAAVHRQWVLWGGKGSRKLMLVSPSLAQGSSPHSQYSQPEPG